MSRETRRLLAAAGLALLALWILARLRFPEQPGSPNPVTPVLTQISPPTTFADLSAEADQVRQRIAPLLVDARFVDADTGEDIALPAVPWRDDLAIAFLPSDGTFSGSALVAVDPPTQLAILRLPTPIDRRPAAWTPAREDQSRYVFAAVPGLSRSTVTPVFLGALEGVASPAWPATVWRARADPQVRAGAMLFTATGEWLGVATAEDTQPRIIPAATVLQFAEQLAGGSGERFGELGVEVQHMTPALRHATNATTGVIVTRVDPRGVVAGHLRAGDVIEALNGVDVPSAFAWRVHASRLSTNATASLRLRRDRAVTELALPLTQPDQADPPGLALSRTAATGARVLRVERGSAAARAGLRAGDLITLAGRIAAPTPAQVQQAFGALAPGDALLLAITRGDSDQVVTLVR